ncbi:protein no-on-transient A-like [Montipora capricornis]|uniref:protein no-on-transient A-like n=1 Tax=Montipora capricornis TaxID=246305 RepID=UPI0035F19877
MRSLLDGSVPVAQRAQLQKNYHISDQDLQDFPASGPSTACGSRPMTVQKRPRRRPLPPSPAHNRGSTGRGRGGDGGGGGSPGGSPGGGGGSPGKGGRGGGRRLDKDGLRRQMDLLSQDTCQRTDGHHIRNITHTNMVTTVYEDGGTPTVRRTSSRISNPSP